MTTVCMWADECEAFYRAAYSIILGDFFTVDAAVSAVTNFRKINHGEYST